jgi:hypothetical protein
MFDLFLATDAVHRRMNASLDPEPRKARARGAWWHQQAVVRSTTAAALHRLADLLEPSHSGEAREPAIGR